MIDIKEWFVMPSMQAGWKLPDGTVYGREQFHLEGTKPDGSAAEKVYHTDTGYSMWFTKSPQGYPHDVKPYDSEYIYDRATELNWTSPRDFKQFAPVLAMCPRFSRVDEGVASSINHASSNYETWQNCAKISQANVGAVRFEMEWAGNVDYAGEVGVTPTVIIRYFWNGSGAPIVYNDREELYLTQRAGWVKWTHATLQNGVYYIDNAVLHNRIVAGGPPPIQFPCISIP